MIPSQGVRIVTDRDHARVALTKGIVGEGRALYRAVVDADLEGIVAKHLADAYHPKLTPGTRFSTPSKRLLREISRPRTVPAAARNPSKLASSRHGRMVLLAR
jgi:hypothetical protein